MQLWRRSVFLREQRPKWKRKAFLMRTNSSLPERELPNMFTCLCEPAFCLLPACNPTCAYQIERSGCATRRIAEGEIGSGISALYTERNLFNLVQNCSAAWELQVDFFFGKRGVSHLCIFQWNPSRYHPPENKVPFLSWCVQLQSPT